MQNSLLFALLFILLNSCSSTDIKPHRFTSTNKHPEPEELMEQERLLVITSLNDINGQLSGVESQGITIGGYSLIENYLSILKNYYQEKMITISTGHLVPHAASEQLSKSIIDRLTLLPIDFYGVSYREIEGLSHLKKSSSYQFLNSNIFQIQTGKLVSDPPLLASSTKRVNGINLGLISVAIPNDKKLLSGLYFQDIVTAVLKMRNDLVKKNADVIILISHENTFCETLNPDEQLKAKLECSSSEGLSKLLKRLPPQTIDVIIATGENFSYGRHSSGVYILNTPGNGLYLGHLQLIYNLEEKSINHDKTSLFVPTLLCGSFFELTKDCYVGDDKERIKALVESKFSKIPAVFFGEQLKSP